MKRIAILFTLITFTYGLFAQSWSFEKGNDVFDGEYRTASIIGDGDEYPYEDPMFVINVFKNDTINPNIYLTNVPCACCDNLKIQVKFDNDDKIYETISTTNNNQNIWFFKFNNRKIAYWDYDKQETIITSIDGNLEYRNFIFNVMNHKEMYIRLSNECLLYNCVFSLTGSTKALKYVFNNKQ